MMNIKTFDSGKVKMVRSEGYNYNFNKKTGYFERWGKTKEDDPLFAPFPEIMDLEISSGLCRGSCPFCYKDNGLNKKVFNMTFDTFKTIFDKLPKGLTQIAFGICDIYTNPDFFKMMEYCREHGVIPNYTTSGIDLDDEAVDKTAKLCGAVSVSIHDKEKAFDAIKKFTDAGMTQVNVHWVSMKENYEDTLAIIEELTSDSRTKNMNSLVLLGYKNKGRNNDVFHPLKDSDKFTSIIDKCKKHGLSFGFDSCSAPAYFKAIEKDPQYVDMATYGESCESTRMSLYINDHGMFFPCSFTEGEAGWKEGLDVVACEDFTKNIWNNPRTVAFRNRLVAPRASCASCPSSSFCSPCPVFDVTSCV